MATFVIVHGSWGGGWEWDDVADRLRTLGHDTRTPTLAGVGVGQAEPATRIGLETHVEDVIEAIGSRRDVVLVGHSYGGAVATVVGSRIPDRLGALVYIDGFVPSDGQSVVDLVDPGWARTTLLEPAEAVGDGWRVPFPFPDDLDDYPLDVADRYRSGWHPLATLTDPAAIHGRGNGVPTFYVHCVRKAPGEDAFVQEERKARDAGWPVFEIDSGHDVQVEDPGAIAALLDRLAGVEP